MAEPSPKRLLLHYCGSAPEVAAVLPNDLPVMMILGGRPHVMMTTEEDSGKRSRHQRHNSDGPRVCPICGLSIRRQDLEAHHQSELMALQTLSTEGSKHSRYPHRKRKKTVSVLATEEQEEGPPSSRRYEEYLRLRRKRETRSRNKAATESGGASTSGQASSTTKCPICGIVLVGSPEEMNRHAEACLIKQTGGVDEEEDVNIDDDESFEEYTWCGETRVRATTLLEGGLQGCGYKTVKSTREENADDELDVEGDESAEFGPVQYTEENLIHLQDSPEQDATASNGTGTLHEERHSNVYHDRGQQTGADNPAEDTERCAIANGPTDGTRADSSEGILDPAEMIKSLKKQLATLNKEVFTKAPIRCLVCLDVYRKPVVSVQCWHVYCEDCWMRTLGAKKLCPQCQMITSPSQLRRIYL